MPHPIIPKRFPLTSSAEQAVPGQSPQKQISLIQSLMGDVASLPHRDDSKLDGLKRRTKMILSQIFGSSTPYLQDMKDIHFYPTVAFSGMDDTFYDRAWNAGVTQLANLLSTVREDLELWQPDTAELEIAKTVLQSGMKKLSSEVFIVHGHDEEMKSAVARVLEKLQLKPIILHEQPDMGRTVIEKFIGHSEVAFAVVLFSPDDLAFKKTDKPETARPRARQNVVLELGFFLGKIGRERVVVLHRQAPDFELPSDYAGVLFKPFDSAGAWRVELLKELNANGFAVDANMIC